MFPYAVFIGGIIVITVLLGILALFLGIVKPNTQQASRSTVNPAAPATRIVAISNWHKVPREMVSTIKGSGVIRTRNKISTDGGKTWQKADNSQSKQELRIASHPSGSTLIVNQQSVASAPNAGSIDEPYLTQDPLTGKYRMTYTVDHRQLWYVESVDRDRWTKPTVLASSTTFLQNAPSITPLLYRQNRKELCTNGGKVITAFDNNALDDSEPAVVSVGDLVIVVYAVSGRGLYRVRSIDNGQSWSPAHLILADSRAARPQLAADEDNGNLFHLVYLSVNAEEDKVDVYYTISRDKGLSFSPIALNVLENLPVDITALPKVGFAQVNRGQLGIAWPTDQFMLLDKRTE